MDVVVVDILSGLVGNLLSLHPDTVDVADFVFVDIYVIEQVDRVLGTRERRAALVELHPLLHLRDDVVGNGQICLGGLAADRHALSAHRIISAALIGVEAHDGATIARALYPKVIPDHRVAGSCASTARHLIALEVENRVVGIAVGRGSIDSIGSVALESEVTGWRPSLTADADHAPAVGPIVIVVIAVETYVL